MVGAGGSTSLNSMVGGLATLGGQLQGQPLNPDAELSQEEDDDAMQVLYTREALSIAQGSDLNLMIAKLRALGLKNEINNIHQLILRALRFKMLLKVLGSDLIPSSNRDRSSKKRRRRRADVAQWTDPAVKILIGVLRLLRRNLMYEEDVERAAPSPFKPISGSNKQIWKSVAKALQLQGHNFDAGQCKTKFKGLKTEYHSILEALGITNVHSHVPENWEDIPNLQEEVREKIRKFKNFLDMRGYFMGLPVADAESLFNGEKPDEFLRSLHASKENGHRLNLESDKEENYLDRLLTLTIDSETTGRRLDGKLLKRKLNPRLPTISSQTLSKNPPPVQSNSHPVWPTPNLPDEGPTRGEVCIPEVPESFNDPKNKDMGVHRIFSQGSLETESRLREEYRAKKLMLKERRLTLAEKQLQIELLKAENEKHRLANEMRKLDLEERRLKFQEDQLSSSSNTLNIVTNLMSQKFS